MFESTILVQLVASTHRLVLIFCTCIQIKAVMNGLIQVWNAKIQTFGFDLN